MNRDAILAAVRAHQGTPCPLPTIPSFEAGAPDVLATRFKTVLEQVGGRWVQRTPGSDLAEIIRSHYPDAERIVSTVDEPPGSTFAVAEDTAPAGLIHVELAIVRGRLGVAENGAVWVDEERLPHRALPFVAEHLVLLLAPDDVVPDMHAAYAALAGRRTGYGVFISGPSKTADIEQSLVIGAQGSRSLLVVCDGAVADSYGDTKP
ncbi:MAG: LUD domain-containing protein [Gemmatimonadales bacterium]|nr:LUD domain-containing protein [Gemmatimonadales bacterium]